jgi:hypothetical protein
MTRARTHSPPSWAELGLVRDRAVERT